MRTPKYPSKLLLIACAAVIGLSACQTTKLEKKEYQVSRDTSRIIIELPVFDGASERATATRDVFTKRSWLMLEQGSYRAEFFLSELYGGRIYKCADSRSAKDDIPMWPYLKNHDVVYGEIGEAVSTFGELHYQRFEIMDGGQKCFAIRLPLNRSLHDSASRFTKLLQTYYCVFGHEPDANKFVQGIKLRDIDVDDLPLKGADAQPDVELSQGSHNFAGVWEGELGTIKGIILLGKNIGREQSAYVQVDDSPLHCFGKLFYLRGKFGTEETPSGSWSITCNDDTEVSGTYQSSSPGNGVAEGTDDKGNAVRIVYTRDLCIRSDMAQDFNTTDELARFCALPQRLFGVFG